MSISLSGSLLLTGSIVASGNLTTTGTITAQTLVVQTITSSIVNITGSNIFGSRTTDRQTFTGSLFITGSSANFSNQVCGLMGNFSCMGIGMTSPQAPLHLIRSLGSDVISIGESGTNTRFTIGQESAYTGNYINSRNIDLKLQAYCAGGSGGNILFQTGTDGTGCVTTKMFLCSNGNLGIGTTSMSTEANLFLGNQGSGAANEGGQLVLQKGFSCACATHLDNFSDSFRVLVGSDTSSNGVHFLVDHKTRNACFYGSIIQSPVVTYAASVSPPSPYTADLRLSITHSSWGGNNDSGTLYVEYQGRAYGNNQTTTAFGVITYRLDSNGVSITNVSTAGVTLSNVSLSTDTSTNLILRVTFAVAQAVDRASIFARTTNSFVTAISADTV